jgi:ABC-type amino acid transport substrate-binding protein
MEEKMKKLLAILLALACLFALASCAAKEETPDVSAEPTDAAESGEIAEPVGDYSDLTYLAIPLTDEEYAIGFRVGSDLTSPVNAAIETLKANGTLATLADKYGVTDLLITSPDEPDNAQSAAAPQDGDFAAIAAAGKLVIGITEYEPMNYKDASGKWIGFDTEFAEAVCAILGVAPEFVEINWDTKEIELAGKQIDCIWNGLTVTEDRRENMDFSLSYLRNEQTIVVKKVDADKYVDASSFAGLTVVAEEGSAGEVAAEGLEGANYVAVAAQSSAFLEVKAGTADAAVVDITMARELTK